MKYSVSLDKIFNEIKDKKEKESNSILIDKIEDRKKRKNYEIKDFIDTFNFNGQEYEIHVQILLAQILKCYEEKEESFKFLCNIEYNIENIYQGINKIELDFIINNLEANLFTKFINYLGKNILLLKFRGNIYEIKEGKNISDIDFTIEDNKKFDILWEIGLNAIDDTNKVDQFDKYS